MKKDRRCDNCHAQAADRITSCRIVHLTTLEFVASD